MARLGQTGLFLCFDVGHSTGQYPNQPRSVIFDRLLNDAHALAPYTKLIHINTTIAPLNGTDSHHGILPEDFAKNVFPDKNQLQTLLAVFNQDALLVPEPQQKKMIENYSELCRLSRNQGDKNLS